MGQQECISNSTKLTSNFMIEVQTYLPHFLGQSWDIYKFHEMVHIAFNILLFGAHKSVYTCPVEYNHIALAKTTI